MTSQKMQRRFQGAILLVALLFISGCLKHQVPDVSYFSLLTMEQLGESRKAAALPDISLGIGPVSIPDSLQRYQIVTRTDGNRYAFDEFHRWAGVLEDDLSVVLGDNLGHLLDVETIAIFPWLAHFQPTYRIIADIQRLDGDLSGEAVLSVRWLIADGTNKNILVSRKNSYRQPLEEAGYAALVKAESQLVSAWSKDISAEIVALEK